jgi:hypothetical protein
MTKPILSPVRYTLYRVATCMLLAAGCADDDPTGLVPADIATPTMDVQVQFDWLYATVTSNAFGGVHEAAEPSFVRYLSRVMTGEVVYVGEGCSAPLSPSPAGKIALIERGGCYFDNKVARAQLAGAIGVIIFETGRDTLIWMGGTNPVQTGDADVVGTEITIWAMFVVSATGVALRDGTSPVTLTATPPSAARVLARLYYAVEGGIGIGYLTPEQGKPLLKKLNLADQHIAKDNRKAAANAVESFIKQVDELEAEGVLFASWAAYLREQANRWLRML